MPHSCGGSSRCQSSSMHYLLDFQGVLNFLLPSESSIVLKPLCLKRFFPMPFGSMGLSLMWWWDILGLLMIIRRLFRIG